MASHHTTTVVVDFDDTLAFTKTRDWANAIPNIQLIEKLNRLFDSGWDIHIVTARGQLSCGGDSYAADAKYRPQITAWLVRNGVKYTSLSFQKKLAAYYIDDKGCTPETFLSSFDRIPLQGGWSGAKVEYDRMNKCVYKTASNTPSVVKWFDHANRLGYYVPEIHTVIGDTIKMEYIDSSEPFDPMTALVLAFSFAPHAHVYYPEKVKYSSYVERCVSRARGVFAIADVTLIETLLTSIEESTPYTFSHGDFSISNLLTHGGQMYMIDPISDPGLYSSFVIDIAKLYTTARMHSPAIADVIRSNFIEEFDSPRGDTVLDIHSIGHLLRMYPYATSEKKGYIYKEVSSILKNYAIQP